MPLLNGTGNYALVQNEIRKSVQAALEEDIGPGDLTAALLEPDQILDARIISREQAVFCGRDWFNEVFRQLDKSITIRWRVEDGDTVQADQILCRLTGPAPALLTGERTALNFLQTLSGIATKSRRYANEVAGTGVKVLDTRKTLPGWRQAEKYAVRCGGCDNHRMGLYDAMLIKENHIAAAGSVVAALSRARQQIKQGIPVEIEVENLAQLEEALGAGAKRILLDNFDLPTTQAAVEANQGQAELELSGGVDLDKIRTYAETGVDFISVGDLTKNITAIDFSMRYIVETT